jgi:hypothetical protein
MVEFGLERCPKCRNRSVKIVVVRRRNSSINLPVKQAVCTKCDYKSPKWNG